MKANTLYCGYTHESEQIEWFWETLQNDFTIEDIGFFAQFVTGSSRIPLEGLKIKIMKTGSADRFPSAHTCGQQLDLPPYDDKETLKEKLMLAVQKAHEGFGFR